MIHPYLRMEQWLRLIHEPDRDTLFRIYEENLALFRTAPGSKHNHQAWPGGYLDHVTETANIGMVLYSLLGGPVILPFTLSSALKIMFLHDIEKPWRFREDEHGRMQEMLKSKVEKAEFREGLMEDFGVVLTTAEANAMRYVEGEHRRAKPSGQVGAWLRPAHGIRLDEEAVNAFTYIEGSHGDYRNSVRSEGPLATFCHLWWTASYAVWHDKAAVLGVPTLYAALDGLRPLPFTLEEAQAVIRLYVAVKEDKLPYPGSPEPRGWITLRNIVRYPGEDPLPHRMGPLAGFCHMCDVASARLWPDHPSPTDDPWEGAARCAP